jgi:hypothetical protein
VIFPRSRTVIAATSPPQLTDLLAAFLKGENVSWLSLATTADALLEFCDEQDLTGLVHLRLCALSSAGDWPPQLREAVAASARADAARELLRRAEILTVLRALAAAGVQPILLKGTALAYTVYDVASARRRLDTDILVPRAQVESARRTMSDLGYTAPLCCDGERLLCQFGVEKADLFGVEHAFDIHWKISTQSIFADLLTYDEFLEDAVLVPALGPDARSAGLVHALLLACLHPAMHHRNVERLVWTHDVHLLASRCSPGDLDRFVDLAIAKGVAAICAHGLGLARRRFASPVPDAVFARLAGRRGVESSSAYLDTERRWHHELTWNVRNLPRWRDRAVLVREVMFPGPGYMLKAYGVWRHKLGMMLLPGLYAHRLTFGIWKIVAGRK